MNALQTFGLLLVGAALGRLAVAMRGPLAELLAARRRDAPTTEPEVRRQAADAQSPGPWRGWRDFVVVGKEPASADGACSLLLAPEDGTELPPFKPGQYLTLYLELPDCDRPVIRCYSLSRPSDPNSYEITVQRRLADQAGRNASGISAATYLIDQLPVGARLRSQAPRGGFVLEPRSSAPLVLVAGGAGVTPIASMLEHLANAPLERDVFLFVAARDGRSHVLRERVARVVSSTPQIRAEVFYSRPTREDKQGRDYGHGTRLTIDQLRDLVPGLATADVYLCAPPAMMADLARGLGDAGVHDARLHFDCWGPESVRATRQARPESSAIEVNFQRSGKICKWDPSAASLLDFAEENGVQLASGCRSGNCGACLTVTSGTVRYIRSPDAIPEPGTCLACIAIPAGPITLDA